MICDDQPELSSFDRNWASSEGARHHSVPVPTRSFGSILEEFGRALYCKIDIEGSDYLCLEAISPPTRPRYISVEIDDAARELRCLHELGYRRFKIISQTTFNQPRAWLASLNARATPLRRRLIASLERRLRRGTRQTDRHWGPSGPFGEETRGKWLDFSAALELTRLLAADPRPTDWYDIHAAE